MSPTKPVQLPLMKTILRYISKQGITNPEMGVWSIEEVDAYVGAWLEKGYRLVNAFYIGEAPEGYGVMFLLAKEPE